MLADYRICRSQAVSENHLPALPNASTFASELIKARAESGWTQNKLAEKSGVSLSAIKGYEAGRNMPGARELRELCQALQISPNKILFGTELPFEQRSIANLLIEGTPENEHVSSVRLALLYPLLAKDEQTSLDTLIRSLAIARHGIEKVNETLKAADLLTGIGRELTRQTGVALKTSKFEVSATDFEKNVTQFMDRQGHPGPPEKLR